MSVTCQVISTLAYGETCAVIQRMQREEILAEILTKATFEALEEGPWPGLNVWHDWAIVRPLSEKWSLGERIYGIGNGKASSKGCPRMVSVDI
ncbi:MAG: hypothetical protein SWE60_09170 [Thermodesulfobacteriota bacterium]|nr:hypothetical protein [Thermodesulfobacteriota bacterium]